MQQGQIRLIMLILLDNANSVDWTSKSNNILKDKFCLVKKFEMGCPKNCNPKAVYKTSQFT